ncbi:MAG TPA: methylmalonyl Co-A mutase-associated GTPase MeaB [Candidatus Deferrimicrobium sp.]|nr:methylmalonyl Co-A mutase-associated GTPase MeaB [Candidatus Deferrimicrobium sp.]
MHELVERLTNGDRRAAARIISLVENEASEKEQLLRELFPFTGRAIVIGVTGSPGAGKSSLVDSLVSYYRKQGLTIGVIAVDPTSPFSGGAILGDRIRMQDHALDRGVFIRSMGTRGSLGGLARATKEAIKVLDAYGRDIILVETVGVGQSELDIMAAADTTMVVLNPGAGDGVQTIKAGIMEIADVFVVNKCDRDGADKTAAEVEAMLDLGHGQNPNWRPPVVKTSTLDGRGIEALTAKLAEHREFSMQSGDHANRRATQLKAEVNEIVEHYLKEMLWNRVGASLEMSQLLEDAGSRKLDPYTIARKVLSTFE